MKEENIQSYFITPEKEAELWLQCTFVFDTSALLEFYYFSNKSQQNIFNDIFEKIKNRLWIPQHVEFEYLKNREETINKPIEEKYKKLENEDLKVIQKGIKEILNRVHELGQQTKKEETHPYIDNTITQQFENICNNFHDEFIHFEQQIKEEFEKRVNEINSLLTQDIVLENFKKYFVVGNEFSFERIMDIIKEGEIRYKSKIPPGYKDGEGRRSKEGIQKFGDLIIWKQIIEYAKCSQKPIVFIINDVKEDWCYTTKRSNEKRIDRPREDLIKEIKDFANVDFWMYTFSQFLFVANKLLGTLITEEVIKEAESITLAKYPFGDKIRFDGLYQSNKASVNGTNYRNYLRFFDDGSVVSVSSSGTPQQVVEWLTKEYDTSGKFSVEGDYIKFIIFSILGSVEYEGVIEQDVLNLSVVSHINGNTSNLVYNFVSDEGLEA